MKCELIAIGTELLLGEIVNNNGAFLAQQMADLGIDVYFHTVVGDNLDRIVGALTAASQRAELIVTSGGLGPTMDDATREAFARFTKRPLVLDEEAYRNLAAYYAQRGIEMTERSKRQVTIPEGAELIPNANGTAPGIWLEHERGVLVALPGPPRELRPMFLDHVKPRLRDLLPAAEQKTHLYRRILKVCGMPEATVEQRLEELIRDQVDPTIAPYAKSGEIHLRLATKAQSQEEADARFAPIEAEIKRRLGWHLYGRDDEQLIDVVAARLQERGLRVAVGESCTGGLVGAKLTELPGSSRHFQTSIVAYANEMKTALLGVPAAMIETHGAVSDPVARALANGARRVGQAEIGIGVTGIAGPEGGTPEKPVGTVFVAVSGPAGELCHRLSLRGMRDDIRQRTTTHCLAMLLEYIHTRINDNLKK